jgi:tRNA(Ile)-lysidine synthase
MRAKSRIGGLTLLRPLLEIGRQQLRDALAARGQAWREDPSNQSPKYLRNRVRQLLQRHPELPPRLLKLARALSDLRQWSRRHAPQLAPTFAARQLCDVPRLLAREAARQWLVASGATQRKLADDVLDRLLAMARDAASPARCQFPGGLNVRRKQGMIFFER